MKRHYIRGVIAFAVLAVVIGAITFNALRTSTQAELKERIEQCKSSTEKRACFTSMIMSAARMHGVAEGLDVLTDIYAIEPEFIEDCHVITHDLGALSFDAFRTGRDFSLSPRASSCGFGFYHGFMEAMLAANGDLSEAKRFCEYVDRKMKSTSGNISAACYHGIGHGFVDGADKSKWGSESAFIERGLTLCAALGKIDSDTEHLTRCASGVFNSLAIAYLDSKYRLTPNPKDPFGICKQQKYQYEKTACYDQMNGYVSHSYKTFSDALRAVNSSAEPAYRTVAFRSLATSEASVYLTNQNSSGDAIRTAELGECKVALPEFQTVCAKGFGTGLVEVGDPTRGYENAAEICAEDPDFKAPCLDGVAQAARDWAPPARQKKVCAAIRMLDSAAGGRCDSLSNIPGRK